MATETKVAVIDGSGESATVDLYVEDEDGELLYEIGWPDSRPSWVSRQFLEEYGFEVRTA